MAEIAFWRERKSTLGALSDQIQLPVIQKILGVITKTHPGLILTLDETTIELNKYLDEAEDNLRFLSTLEGHFMVNLFKSILTEY